MNKIAIAGLVVILTQSSFAKLGGFGGIAAKQGANAALKVASEKIEADKQQKAQEEAAKQAEAERKEREAKRKEREAKEAEEAAKRLEEEKKQEAAAKKRRDEAAAAAAKEKLEKERLEREAAEKKAAEIKQYGAFEDRIATFCGITFGSEKSSKKVTLAKPFRLFKTANLTLVDGRVQSISLDVTLPAAMSRADARKEFEAIKDILTKKYHVEFSHGNALWDSDTEYYKCSADGGRIELFYTGGIRSSSLSLVVTNMAKWKAAAAPAPLAEDEGADAL